MHQVFWRHQARRKDDWNLEWPLQTDRLVQKQLDLFQQRQVENATVDKAK